MPLLKGTSMVRKVNNEIFRQSAPPGNEIKLQHFFFSHRLKTWKFDPRGIEQCRDGLTSEIEERALKEGCQIYGYLEVNR